MKHIKTAHTMSLDEYCSTYSMTKRDLISTTSHNKLSTGQRRAFAEGRSVGWGFGDKNPSRSPECKSGRNSVMSMNFKGYDGLTDDEKHDKIQSVVDSIQHTMKSNCNNPLTINYYVKRGASEQEAIRLLSKRQSTFSKEKCIHKFGEQLGIAIWRDRQERWQRTMNSKSAEELDRINRSKMSNGTGYSKISQELFRHIDEALNGKFAGVFYATNGVDPGVSNEMMVISSKTNKTYFLDFYVQETNKVIEFDGDYWHNLPGSDVHDKMRDDDLKSLGYTDILHVKEHDYRQSPDDVIRVCIDFLNTI